MSKGKKLNDFSDLGGLVYSTGSVSKENDDEQQESVDPSEQLLEVHYEKKGRGGKTAVIIKGFEGSDNELKELSKELKSYCAVGGSVKNGEIIIQGNVRDKIMSYLKEKKYGVKRVGG